MSLLKSLTLACAALLPTTALADWSGWYAGGSAGSVTDPEFSITSGVGLQVNLEDTSNIGGFFGTLTQNGSVVYGAELEITSLPDLTGTSIEGVTVEHNGIAFELKSRLGFALGDILPYGVLGISTSSFANNLLTEDFDQSGLSYGVGVDFLVTDELFIGVEYLSRQASGVIEVVGAGFAGQIDHESSIESLSVRAGFKF